MDDLIKALQILAKYEKPEYPLQCEHDILYVMIDPESVPMDDVIELQALGFEPDFEEGHFYSHHYGSV